MLFFINTLKNWYLRDQINHELNLKKYTSEFKNNLRLATPVMIGSLGHLMVGLIDDIMVGRLGPVELAATSLGNSIVFIALSIGLGFSFAITPLIAESDSEEDEKKGENFERRIEIFDQTCAKKARMAHSRL